jgi:SAM-dependent methyltransferase
VQVAESTLRSAASAFDAIAPDFDTRFGAWASVAAQRRAVRSVLLREFPQGGALLEVGGGTGEDGAFLAKRGYSVLLTDASPAMVDLARRKLRPLGSDAEIVAGEDLHAFADRYLEQGKPLFDGVFSNFAPLNCVKDLAPIAQALGVIMKPGAVAALVVFGTCCPSEMLVELLRGRPWQMFRRFNQGSVHARLAKREFEVFYHRRQQIEADFRKYFELERRIGIGVAVPPSAAEPWISKHPMVLAALEACDRLSAGPLAMFGDHVLYQFRRRG